MLLPLLAAIVILCSPSISLAYEFETLSSHCNDAPFGSDGGGISGCIDLAARYQERSAGIALSGVTPEQKTMGGFRTDPLEEKARINAWIARESDWNGYDYSFALRAGVEGGAADDVALTLKEEIHKLAGYGNRELYSHNGSEFIAGASAWIRGGLDMGGFRGWAAKALPYVHGTLGLDAVEAGTGLMLALQPGMETKNMALVLPKNAAYAATFGGDGIAIFGGVRAVAHEGLYEKLADSLVAEAGITAQATLFGFVRIGVSSSCTTKAYEGARDPDCKMSFQLGGLF